MSKVAEAILHVFRQPMDHGSEPETITEAVGYLRNSLNKIAYAISADAAPGKDASGGTVNSLTEAVMGTTAGLFAIAGAIERLAEAIEAKAVSS